MENEQIDELSDASLDDEFVLSATMPDRVFGFHAQQAIEKLLKMLILGNRTMYEFTHDIERLQTKLVELGETIPPLPFPIVDLSDYAAQFRYSRPHALSFCGSMSKPAWWHSTRSGTRCGLHGSGAGNELPTIEHRDEGEAYPPVCVSAGECATIER